MRLHRFFIDQEIGDRKEIAIDSAEFSNQIRRVFRLRPGDSIVVFNGTGFDYECKIDRFENGAILKGSNHIQLTVASVYPSRCVPTRKIFLCSAIVKKDTFEWISQKATELGVTDIVPVLGERSEKKNINDERLKKIVVEASEQSGRGDVPRISESMRLPEAIGFVREQGVEVLAFHTEGVRFQDVPDIKSQAIAVFIGPEGGWSDAELLVFHDNNVPVVCLGPQVLRAETAAVAALSMVVFA